ncbi:MAG: hypothetical protein MK209_07850 [Planctomycetes bacterium]|nr:hypothetical protein [Planctomycetota bacterium]
MSLSLLLTLTLRAFISPGGSDTPVSVGGLHPSDGPDADVRIQVEPERVRFFIMLNLAFVDEIVDVAREADDDLHPVEAPWVREALLDYFKEENQVEINDQLVEPVDAGFEMLEPDLTLLPLFPRMGKKALVKLQLILDYPAVADPRRVRMVWGAYPPDLAVGSEGFMPTVTIRAQLFSGGIVSPVEFIEAEPEFTLHATGETATDRMLAVPEAVSPERLQWPIISSTLVLAGTIVLIRRRFDGRALVTMLVTFSIAFLLRRYAHVELPFEMAGASLPDASEAEEIFLPLHANMYRAFDYTAESDIYDALERSVDGDLLDELYEQVYRGLIQQEQGGAVSRVQEVRPLEVEVKAVGRIPDDGRLGFTVETRWQIDGRVTHWGHSHDRTNEYHARYAVVQTSEGWRIGGSQILASQTVSATPEGSGG